MYFTVNSGTGSGTCDLSYNSSVGLTSNAPLNVSDTSIA